MESAPLALGFLKPLLWLLPFLILIAFLKSATFKGWLGEKFVSKKASLHLPSCTYHAFHNVTIPDGSDTTQIDHIYVARFGVFVVETKNMSGWIFGSEQQAQWTQSIYKNKFKFQNPLRQNYKHIKTLENLLQLPASKMHTVIVFTGDSTIKTALPKCVCTLANFTGYIKSFTESVMTEGEVLDICSKIGTSRLVASQATHNAHVRNLRRKHRQ